MRKLVGRSVRVLVIIVALLHIALPVVVQTETAEVVNQANRFLASLSPEQRRQVLYAYNDATQRARWSNFPTGVVPRGGISLKQMTAAQQTAAFDLLKAVLSPMDVEKVNEIRMADDDFKVNGSQKGPHGPHRRVPPGHVVFRWNPDKCWHHPCVSPPACSSLLR